VRARIRTAAAVACALALLGSACGAPADDVVAGDGPSATGSAEPEGSADPAPAPQAGDVPEAAPGAVPTVEPPGPLRDPLLPADLLVYAQDPLDEADVAAVRKLPGVTEVEPLSVSNVAVEDRIITLAAVDPASYRRFTPVGSAQLEEVWQRVAGGELAILPGLGKRLQDRDGYVTLGNDEGSAAVHVGAYAPQVPQVDAVVNEAWAEELGMREGNALLVSTGLTAPQAVRPRIAALVGRSASIQVLGPDLDITATQTAFLTGGSVAQAVGTFSYSVLGGGRIAPDPAWVAANIRTETVPILGQVTCHKVMLPQFRAALIEIVQRGLADEINPGEYAGCYYPRFIAGSTSLSLHSWGIAFDVNVPGNLRGTVGEIDRDVVAIFEKWGFAWGGRWRYTDPMHFELARLVEAR